MISLWAIESSPPPSRDMYVRCSLSFEGSIHEKFDSPVGIKRQIPGTVEAPGARAEQQ